MPRTRLTASITLRFLADFSIALIVLVAVFGLLQISKGYAFPAPLPPDLLTPLAATGLTTGSDCPTGLMSLAALVSETPAYASASAGPNLSALPMLGAGLSTVLAFGIAVTAAVNLAIVRHVSSLIATSTDA